MTYKGTLCIFNEIFEGSIDVSFDTQYVSVSGVMHHQYLPNKILYSTTTNHV
jgi:hypothetical protein